MFINTDATTVGAPECATFKSRMTIDLTVPAGKTMYAHLLSLRILDPEKVITFSGAGVCSWIDTESVGYVNL